jgi:hypothetical protein
MMFEGRRYSPPLNILGAAMLEETDGNPACLSQLNIVPPYPDWRARQRSELRNALSRRVSEGKWHSPAGREPAR